MPSLPPVARCLEWKTLHCLAVVTRETTPFRFSRQWRQWRRPRAGGGPVALAVINLVSLVINEARDGAVWSDGPTIRNVQDRYGVKIQRVRGLPDCGGNFADTFAVRPDGHAQRIVGTGYRRAIAAGLLV